MRLILINEGVFYISLEKTVSPQQWDAERPKKQEKTKSLPATS
jgi:hypothetical protein